MPPLDLVAEFDAAWRTSEYGIGIKDQRLVHVPGAETTIYAGQIKNGMKHGLGVERRVCNIGGCRIRAPPLYEGEFANGERNGYGLLAEEDELLRPAVFLKGERLQCGRTQDLEIKAKQAACGALMVEHLAKFEMELEKSAAKAEETAKKNHKKREHKKKAVTAKHEVKCLESVPEGQMTEDQRVILAGVARQRWQRAVRCVVLKRRWALFSASVRKERHHAAETRKHEAESEARRKIREAANAKKRADAEVYDPAPSARPHAAVGAWAVEDPGESVHAKARGKKAEALEERKLAIHRRRAEEAARQEKCAKEAAERERLLAVGDAMMRDQREPVQLR